MQSFINVSLKCVVMVELIRLPYYTIFGMAIQGGWRHKILACNVSKYLNPIEALLCFESGTEDTILIWPVDREPRTDWLGGRALGQAKSPDLSAFRCVISRATKYMGLHRVFNSPLHTTRPLSSVLIYAWGLAFEFLHLHARRSAYLRYPV